LTLGWAKAFKHKDLPFHLVQIAPYDYDKKPNISTLCENIWAAQYQSITELNEVHLVPIHDTIGTIRSIHPSYKKPVGERLAQSALKHQYGKVLAIMSPTFKSAALENGTVVIEFEQSSGGLSTHDENTPSWFKLSDDGKNFRSANAKIENGTVILEIPQDLDPQFVRMGWQDVATPNLINTTSKWPALAFPPKEITK
jgi:sialate O-acetylesterase